MIDERVPLSQHDIIIIAVAIVYTKINKEVEPNWAACKRTKRVLHGTVCRCVPGFPLLCNLGTKLTELNCS